MTQPHVTPSSRRAVAPALWVGGGALAVIALLVGVLLVVRSRYGVFLNRSDSMLPTFRTGDYLHVIKDAYKDGKLPERGATVAFDAPPVLANGKTGIVYIQRVVGLPGDTVAVHAPRVAVNGEELGGPDSERSAHEYLRGALKLNENTPIKIAYEYIQAGDKTITAAELGTRLGKKGARIGLTPAETLVNSKTLEEPYIYEDHDYDYPLDGGEKKLGPDEVFVLGDNRNHSADSHYWGPLKTSFLIGPVKYYFHKE